MGGYIPAAYQSRWPGISNRGGFRICGGAAPLGRGGGRRVLDGGVLPPPGGAVDARRRGFLLAAPPVRRGGSGEGERGYAPGGGQVWPAAEVGPDAVSGARVQVVVHG